MLHSHPSPSRDGNYTRATCFCDLATQLLDMRIIFNILNVILRSTDVKFVIRWPIVLAFSVCVMSTGSLFSWDSTSQYGMISGYPQRYYFLLASYCVDPWSARWSLICCVYYDCCKDSVNIRWSMDCPGLDNLTLIQYWHCSWLLSKGTTMFSLLRSVVGGGHG